MECRGVLNPSLIPQTDPMAMFAISVDRRLVPSAPTAPTMPIGCEWSGSERQRDGALGGDGEVDGSLNRGWGYAVVRGRGWGRYGGVRRGFSQKAR